MKKKPKISEYFNSVDIGHSWRFSRNFSFRWNASKNLENNQKEVLKSIKLEIESNLEIIKSAQSNRLKFNKSLDSLDKVLTTEILKRIFI